VCRNIDSLRIRQRPGGDHCRRRDGGARQLHICYGVAACLSEYFPPNSARPPSMTRQTGLWTMWRSFSSLDGRIMLKPVGRCKRFDTSDLMHRE
jgi:hypothetical protein